MPLGGVDVALDAHNEPLKKKFNVRSNLACSTKESTQSSVIVLFVAMCSACQQRRHIDDEEKYYFVIIIPFSLLRNYFVLRMIRRTILKNQKGKWIETPQRIHSKLKVVLTGMLGN